VVAVVANAVVHVPGSGCWQGDYGWSRDIQSADGQWRGWCDDHASVSTLRRCSCQHEAYKCTLPLRTGTHLLV